MNYDIDYEIYQYINQQAENYIHWKSCREESDI